MRCQVRDEYTKEPEITVEDVAEGDGRRSPRRHSWRNFLQQSWVLRIGPVVGAKHAGPGATVSAVCHWRFVRSAGAQLEAAFRMFCFLRVSDVAVPTKCAT